MTANHEEHPERARALMMAALDGELSSVEQAELDRLLSTDETLRKEWDRLKTVKEVTGTMTFRQPPEEVWDRYWVSVYNQAERGLGWLLFSVAHPLAGSVFRFRFPVSFSGFVFRFHFLVSFSGFVFVVVG